MTRTLALALLLAAVPALAEETKAAPESEKTRPPLKLRLDEAVPVAPRITFTPREEPPKAPADTLPALGGLAVLRRRLRRGRRREQSEQDRDYSTSTMHSISTGIPIGSAAMPTADRAWRPRSPNTSTKRSEQPLITLG